jgi:translation elongation factor EF-Tu-like GTPase
MGKRTSTITGVEMFRKILDREAEITLVFFKRYSKEDIKRGMVICVSQVQLNHTTFKS